MILINLTPIDELENKYWYLPDVIVFCTLLLTAWGASEIYLSALSESIEKTRAETAEIQINIERLKPELNRYDNLKKQMELLKEKIRVLRDLTVSKVERYRPVIILEMIQVLAPRGIWLTSIRSNHRSSTIDLSGGGFDPILIAEFMSNLSEPSKSDPDPTDMRTMLFFSEVFLEKVSTGTNDNSDDKDSEKMSVEEKAFQKTKSNQNSTSSENKQSNMQANRSFSELSDFPNFSLKLTVTERDSTNLSMEMPYDKR